MFYSYLELEIDLSKRFGRYWSWAQLFLKHGGPVLPPQRGAARHGAAERAHVARTISKQDLSAASPLLVLRRNSQPDVAYKMALHARGEQCTFQFKFPPKRLSNSSRNCIRVFSQASQTSFLQCLKMPTKGGQETSVF